MYWFSFSLPLFNKIIEIRWQHFDLIWSQEKIKHIDTKRCR